MEADQTFLDMCHIYKEIIIKSFIEDMQKNPLCSVPFNNTEHKCVLMQVNNFYAGYSSYTVNFCLVMVCWFWLGYSYISS